ncbi:hypothetical protein AB1286_20060 [Trinickia sp. NRRL B-1857]|uniref:hypothetical protein n=1 Tax=Trinickia sp. NRRL B-1857 TaxID=3162879 RepID=UPI003D28403B
METILGFLAIGWSAVAGAWHWIAGHWQLLLILYLTSRVEGADRKVQDLLGRMARAQNDIEDIKRNTSWLVGRTD